MALNMKPIIMKKLLLLFTIFYASTSFAQKDPRFYTIRYTTTNSTGTSGAFSGNDSIFIWNEGSNTKVFNYQRNVYHSDISGFSSKDFAETDEYIYSINNGNFKRLNLKTMNVQSLQNFPGCNSAEIIALNNDSIYAFGGSGSNCNKVYLYRASSNSWTLEQSNAPIGGVALSLTKHQGIIYVGGGKSTFSNPNGTTSYSTNDNIYKFLHQLKGFSQIGTPAKAVSYAYNSNEQFFSYNDTLWTVQYLWYTGQGANNRFSLRWYDDVNNNWPLKKDVNLNSNAANSLFFMAENTGANTSNWNRGVGVLFDSPSTHQQNVSRHFKTTSGKLFFHTCDDAPNVFGSTNAFWINMFTNKTFIESIVSDTTINNCLNSDDSVYVEVDYTIHSSIQDTIKIVEYNSDTNTISSSYTYSSGKSQFTQQSFTNNRVSRVGIKNTENIVSLNAWPISTIITNQPFLEIKSSFAPSNLGGKTIYSIYDKTQSSSFQWYASGYSLSGETDWKIDNIGVGAYQVSLTNSDGCTALSNTINSNSIQIDTANLNVADLVYTVYDSTVTFTTIAQYTGSLNPGIRYNYCSWEDSENIYIFGGKNQLNNLLSDLWKFDKSTQSWALLNSSTTANFTGSNSLPAARQNATCWKYKDELFMMGGFQSNDTKLWSYNIKNDTWSVVTNSSSSPTLSTQAATWVDTSLQLTIIAQTAYSSTTTNVQSGIWVFDHSFKTWNKSSTHDWGTNQSAIYILDENYIFHVFSGFYSPIQYNNPPSFYGTYKKVNIFTGDVINGPYNLNSTEVKFTDPLVWSLQNRPKMKSYAIRYYHNGLLYLMGGLESTNLLTNNSNDTWVFNPKNSKWLYIEDYNSPMASNSLANNSFNFQRNWQNNNNLRSAFIGTEDSLTNHSNFSVSQYGKRLDLDKALKIININDTINCSSLANLSLLNGYGTNDYDNFLVLQNDTVIHGDTIIVYDEALNFINSLPDTIVHCGLDTIYLNSGKIFNYSMLGFSFRLNDCVYQSNDSNIVFLLDPINANLIASKTIKCKEDSIQFQGNWDSNLISVLYNRTKLIDSNKISYSTSDTGLFYASVISNYGCIYYTDSLNIYQYDLPEYTLNSSEGVNLCSQSDSTLLYVQPTNYSSIIWSGMYAQTYDDSLEINSSGSYYAALIDSNGCSVFSDTLLVTQDSIPTLTSLHTFSDTLCLGDSIMLSTNYAGGYVSLWFNGANFIDTISSIWTGDSGQYYQNLFSSNGCIYTSDTARIHEHHSINNTIQIAGSVNICVGDSVLLSAQNEPNYQYTWYKDNVLIDTLFSVAAHSTGNYKCNITDMLSGCSLESSATSIIVNSLPSSVVSVSGSTTFCQGDSVVLSTSSIAGNTYQWKLNSNNIIGATGNSFTALGSGNYAVEVTNSSGCSTTSSSTSVTVLAPVINTSIIGQSTGVTPLNQYTYLVSNDTAITFSWQANNGAIIAGQGTNSVDVIWNQASSGKLTINRSNGFCSATDTLNIITTFNFSEISNKFNIYPNPTKGLIIIENSNNIIAFKLTDSSGKEVLISKTEGQIDISNLPTGSYQLILSTKEGTTTHAIQKI